MSGAGKRRRRGGGRTRPNNEGNGNENPQSNAQFDGTSGPGGAGQRAGVNSPPRSPRAGSPPSRGRSPAPATPTIGSIGQVMQGSNLPLRDPARDPERASRITDMCRNIDLPADAYLLNPEFFARKDLAKRPGYNATGKEITVAVNSYPITQFPTKSVYQYDVHIGNGAEKRAIVQKVWNSRARKATVGAKFIFDGNKLAWSLVRLPSDVNVMVDLDAEQGRSGSRTPNIFRLVVRPTKKVNLAVIEEYIRGNGSMSKEVLEGLSCLDHILRETPSGKFIAIKRSFFSEQNPKASVGGGVFAYKGIYQAIRVVNPGRLALNVDVSNSCFWALISLLSAAIEVLELRDVQQLISWTRPVDDGHGGRAPSPKFHQLSRFHKLAVKASYKGCPCPDREWVIKEFLQANAKEYTIDVTDRATGQVRTMSIFDYFRSRYNVVLSYWELPLVQMTKKGVVYPMEVLAIHRPQKFPFKLNELQTASMIKFAVTRPSERRRAVEESKANLAHATDQVLIDFGLKVSESMMTTKARLLPNPEILFGGNQRVNPGTAGRWDLRGKKFYAKNSKPLTSWGVGVFRSRHVNQADVERFVDAFVRAYQGHGGAIASPRPFIGEVEADPAKAAYSLFHSTGNKFNQRPELLIFIVMDKNAFHYTRVKKSCDCRFGVPSQVLQASQVAKCNGQYISNVLMKVNAKLGGTTARISSKITKGLPPYTMIIGADISHSSPGSVAPSMAAMTVSMDQFGGRYTAACETNGDHVEMISQANIKSMLSPLFREWSATIGQGRIPQNIYYFRDGVSDGEFQQVLQQEIPFIKSLLKEFNKGVEWGGKVTVVVASKRHHIRAFPQPGDRNAADKNGNALPGTLIERDVTSPHGWDFFLWSHIALQGTSRPVHYHVLVDEMNHGPKDLENMIYEHCYQYMRSTTSVSLFPAVYYAHLASNRARAHENIPASSGPRSGPQVKQGQNPPPAEPPRSEGRQLLPIGEGDRLALKMWYI
ncbi:eukaryotic translation initiation factor 2c [Histoplasma capsulatum G186AR]|uniref:Eukaryotic translation initiation factor 2c n=1 Tax=Ajellomyces capsulatus TaxID=5037 RepID=A0A8H7YAG5_AJECA|nr:eukaryotic translation initiation factor 2c [Histoplasma capsulatum]QSS70792.1 eukaryotic translation initiation factor 2c [Histoplasma capsulatum G186AR]